MKLYSMDEVNWAAVLGSLLIRKHEPLHITMFLVSCGLLINKKTVLLKQLQTHYTLEHILDYIYYFSDSLSHCTVYCLYFLTLSAIN